MHSTLDKFSSYIVPFYEKLGVLPEQVVIDIENTTISPAGMNETANGRHVCNLKYSIIFSVERLKNAKITYLFCLIHAFVRNLDTTEKYNLAPPAVTMLDMDDHLRYVEISIDCNDEIFLAPSDKGDIVIGSQSFEISDYTLNIAETSTVNKV